MAGSARHARIRLIVASLACSAMLVGLLAGVGVRPAAAEVSGVGGSAFGFYTNVGLFGGPRTLRGHGTAATPTDIAYSPSVTLPPEGSATPVTANDPTGAKGQYGPAVIFGGKWPAHVSTAPASGPLSVSTQGTVEEGSVTSSASVVLHDPPNADAPGGAGPGPLIADEAHSTCTANESGVSGSATFVNGIVETKTTRSASWRSRANPSQSTLRPTTPAAAASTT